MHIVRYQLRLFSRIRIGCVVIMKDDLRIYINQLIYKFRGGDKKAEKKLFKRYYPRIKMYVYKNVWISELKDPEDLMNNIWLKLRDWFSSNDIRASEKVVIYNIVRSNCERQARKDKREISFGDTEENQNDYFDFFNSIRDRKSQKDLEKNVLKASFYKILSLCLENLTERQRKVINYYFFSDYTYEKIGELLSVSNVTAFNDCKRGLSNLKSCFQSHGVFSLGDIK